MIQIGAEIGMRGPPKGTPNFASIHQLSRVLGEIRVGFSPVFILHVFWFSASEITVDLFLGDMIQLL